MKSVKEKYRSFLNTDCGAQLYNEFKRVVYSREDSLVETLDNTVLQSLPQVRKKLVRVCDIGGADGKRIIRILRYLHGKFQIRFKLDLVEQSEPFINGFDASPIEDFTETRKFHELFEEARLSADYDLVFLIHSIFAFQDGEALEKVLSLPNQDGTIIVVSNSSTSFLAGLKALVDDGYDDKRYEIDSFCRDLDERQITYSCVNFQTRWAISEPDCKNSLGTIMEWISLGGAQAFDSVKERKVSNYIARNTVQSGGRTFFVEDEAIVLVPPRE